MSAQPNTNTSGTAQSVTDRSRTLRMTTSEAIEISPKLIITDVASIVVLGALAASPLFDAYGGYRWLIAVVFGLLFGAGVALASRRWAWGPWTTAIAMTVVYFLAGPALAVPDAAIAGFVPGPEALRELSTGIVNAWRDSLTLLPPLGHAGSVLIVPFVIALLGGLFAGVFLWRSRWPGAAVVVFLAVFVAASAFGNPITEFSIVRGISLAVLLLLWSRWRAMRHVRTAWGRKIGQATLALVLVVGVGTGLTALTSLNDREVLREYVNPPFDPSDYPSPLSKFRAYTDQTNLKHVNLFEVDGVEKDQFVRLATMDYFDGTVWNVTGGAGSANASGTFTRLPAYSVSSEAQPVTVTIENLAGVWVPSVGTSEHIEVHESTGRLSEQTTKVLHNASTGTVAQVGGLSPGLTYRYKSVLPAQPSEDEIAAAVQDSNISLEMPRGVPENLDELVKTWLNESGGTGTAGAQAQYLTKMFTQGFYSDGNQGEFPSLSGHGLKRLSDLTATPSEMVGNDEQYAAALGLALQHLSVPARVVVGAKVPASGVVQGKHVEARVEVNLDGLGWVMMSPTPDEDRRLREQQQEPDPVPQPYIPQPPQIPEEPSSADQTPPQKGASRGDSTWAEILEIVLKVFVNTLKFALITSPLWFLLLVKFLRRRRRKFAKDPVDRLSGGWREVTDRARDLGTKLPHSNTRYENGQLLEQRFPEAGMPTLATSADRHVFGPTTPTDQQVDEYWSDVGTALKQMRRSVPWWRRPLAVLSPASIPWGHARDVVLARSSRRITRIRTSRMGEWTRARASALKGAVTEKLSRRKKV